MVNWRKISFIIEYPPYLFSEKYTKRYHTRGEEKHISPKFGMILIIDRLSQEREGLKKGLLLYQNEI